MELCLCQFRKPLARQVGEFLNIRKAKVLGTTRMKGKEVEVQREVYNNKDEFLNIRKAKVLGTTRIKGKEVEVQREVYNNKDEWFSHCSQWDTVG